LSTSRSFFRGLLFVLFVVGIASHAVAQQFDSSFYGEMQWRMIGPHRGGRTVAATGVPGQPNVFYIGVNNGGVWKTTDAGNTWTPIFDDQPTGSIGALAVAPSNANVIYVGSGEGLRRPDLSVGDGMYKSTDAGRTWNHLGLRDAQQIGAVLVDPRDANRVFVAALGHPYGPNPERGVFRSLDGGSTWEKVLYKDEDTGAIDLAFDPANAQTVYAVLWVSRRGPWHSAGSYDAPGSGLYKSIDGGSTWHQLTGGLPGDAQGLGRIGITVAPSDGRRMYATVEAAQSGGIYRSDDAGETWQRVSTDSRAWGRGSDFAWVRVHPRNKDVIFVANTSTYRSENGGKTFTALKGAPGGDDYHSIWINPDNPEIILLAADQGAVITVNGGDTWSSWYNQPTAQFYHVITDNQFPYWVYGAQQESGSVGIASRTDTGSITFRDWHPVGVEEWGYVAPDPLNPELVYGGKVTRFNRITGQTQDVVPVGLRAGKYRYNRTAPLIFSPVDPRVLYFGLNVLLKTTDGGYNWQEISPDLTRTDSPVPASFGVFVNRDLEKGKHKGVIYSIAPSFQNANDIWIGTDDGLVQRTRDGGKSWISVTPPEVTPWSKVAQLEASHFDSESAYVAVNRFRLDDLKPYIYKTHDGGKTWQKITNGLPDEPVNTVREDQVTKGLLIAGTEHSVYFSVDDGGHWQSLQLNLPPSSMRDLVIHGDDVVVGTHGRSFWILDNITPLRQLNAKMAESSSYLFEPQKTYRMRRNNNTDTPLPPEIPWGKNPPDGAMIDYYLKADASGPVTIEILDKAGRFVRRYSSADKPEAVMPDDYPIPMYWVRKERAVPTTAGMHRFLWDLRYPPPAALDHDYPISAIYGDTPREPLGPYAVPGTYTVRLTVGGKTSTQQLVLTMDPRVKVTQAGLEEQLSVAASITLALQKDFDAVQEVEKLRAELKVLAKNVPSDVSGSVKELDHKAETLLGAGGGLWTPPEQSLRRLNGDLAELLGVVDGSDAAPTPAAKTETGDRVNSLNELLAKWGALKREAAGLNPKLEKAGLPRLLNTTP
jgi:photosystem II stability/assembly factor-like uncharacterized protein